MKEYKLEIKKPVRKFFEKHPELKDKIIAILKLISESPDSNMRLFDIKSLSWQENLYRLRVNKYRIIFEKKDKELIIKALEADSRGDIYKTL